jgi:RNA polymerase sigma-70 factor (ECF subfamily)
MIILDENSFCAGHSAPFAVCGVRECAMKPEHDGHFAAERQRAYLHLLARSQLRSGANRVVDASDIVQQALLQAHQKREQFRGQSEAEYRGWLRRILANVIADTFRNAPAEKAVGAALDQQSALLENLLPEICTTPSQKLDHEEQLLHLANALAKLSDDERTALELRFLEHPPWPLAKIAAHLKRPTAKAVAGLLARGMSKLRIFLQEQAEAI